MNWVRMPACTTSTSHGLNNASGSSVLMGQNNTREKTKPQGNKCGHNKNNPLFFNQPSRHKSRPSLIIKAKKELNHLYFNSLISSAGRMSYNPDNKNKDGSYRKMRSEVRDLVNNCVGECLLHYLDLKTLYVGFQANGKFHYFGIDFIYKTIRESLKNRNATETITYERVRKAIKVYEECSYLTIEKEKIMLPNGRFVSKSAKIRFNRSFFNDLNLDESLISQYIKNEDRKLNSDLLKQKAVEYTHQQRAARKTAKKEMRAIKEVLKAARAGQKLNQHEQEFIDKEYPGIQRRREPETPLYPEYIRQLVKRPPS